MGPVALLLTCRTDGMSLMWSTASHALGQRQPARTQTPTPQAAPRSPIRCSISLETDTTSLQSIRPQALLTCSPALHPWLLPVKSLLRVTQWSLCQACYSSRYNQYQPCMPTVAEMVHNAHAGRICNYVFAHKIVVVFLVHFVIINI